jgi:MFS family permease
MSGRVRGVWPSAAAGVIAVVTVAGLVVVWRSPHRADLEGFVGFAISATGVAAGWIAWVWRHRSSQGSGVISGQELGRLTDLLAGAVAEQWTRAAGEWGLLEPEPIPVRWRQPTARVAVPAAAAVTSTRFAPLPGLDAAGEQQLQAGQVRDLHEMYGGLGSGRLVIAGGPGSGKSSAAVLLILAALRYRRSVSKKLRPEVPVPVMFTLHGWDPNKQRARDWLAKRLWQTYPLFGGKQGAGAARGMLDEGRIAVILDGLDEIPGDLRPTVLRVLSQQATFRLVLLTRSAEMADAADQAMLQGAAAIELEDIDPGDAASYLTRTQPNSPPPGWHELTSRLRQEPRSPLAQALNNPLMLTLVRDTYRPGGDVGELLSLRNAAGLPASEEDIADHLLDRVLPAAYTQQPGKPPPGYDLPTAERTLQCIATRMNKDGTRDLEWWRMPMWASALPRFIATGLMIGLVSGLAVGLGVGLTCGLSLVEDLMCGLAAGLAFGCGCAVLGLGGHNPTRIAPWRWRQILSRSTLVAGWARNWLVGGLAVGLLAGLAVGLLVRPGLGLGITLVIWVVIGLVIGLLGGLSQPASGDNVSPLMPLASWQSDRVFGLVTGLVIGLVGGLALGLAIEFGAGLRSRHGLTLVTWVVIGLVIGLGVGLIATEAWPTSLAFAQLARRWHTPAEPRTPVRLMHFLEDARERKVLRTVGPVYQFRHARLQDRLADQ